MEFLCFVDSVGAIFSLPTNLPVRSFFEQSAQSAPYERAIIDNQDTFHISQISDLERHFILIPRFHNRVDTVRQRTMTVHAIGLLVRYRSIFGSIRVK